MRVPIHDIVVMLIPAVALSGRLLAGDVIPAAGCDPLDSCNLESGLIGDFHQTCGDESWISLAWPHFTDGAVVHSISMLHHSIQAEGDLYLVGDGGGCPDMGNILWTGCCAISDDSTEGSNVYCTGPILTETTTWVVAVPRSSLAFDVAFNSGLEAPNQGYVNLNGDGACENWQDLINFQTSDGVSFGGCYCVGLGTEPCLPGQFDCLPSDEECGAGIDDCCTAHKTSGCSDAACCEAVCEQDPTCCDLSWHDACAVLAGTLCSGLCVDRPCETVAVCDGDANADGSVDPLDVGFVLARFGADPCAPGNCAADVNCDGTIDPLDAGYALARFGTCGKQAACFPDCL